MNNPMDILYAILIGLGAGWLAGVLRRGSGFGLLGNLIVGALGAVLGGFLAKLIGITAYGLLGRLAIATGGAVLLLFLLALISGKSKRP